MLDKIMEKTMEQLEEELRKTKEELAIQKWGTEKTLGGMKVLVKELVQKNEELKKVNKFMVGRELKMVELKKEIEALRQAQGKSLGKNNL